LSTQTQKTEGIIDHPKSSAVIATDASFAVCFAAAVASAAHLKRFSQGAAVSDLEQDL